MRARQASRHKSIHFTNSLIPSAILCCLQHLLVDLVTFLDEKKAYISEEPERLKCNKSSRGCDGEAPGCDHNIKDETLDEVLNIKQNTRWCEAGVWSYHEIKPNRGVRNYDDSWMRKFDIEKVKSMTCTVDLTCDKQPSPLAQVEFKFLSSCCETLEKSTLASKRLVTFLYFLCTCIKRQLTSVLTRSVYSVQPFNHFRFYPITLGTYSSPIISTCFILDTAPLFRAKQSQATRNIKYLYVRADL